MKYVLLIFFCLFFVISFGWMIKKSLKRILTYKQFKTFVLLSFAVLVAGLTFFISCVAKFSSIFEDSNTQLPILIQLILTLNTLRLPITILGVVFIILIFVILQNKNFKQLIEANLVKSATESSLTKSTGMAKGQNRRWLWLLISLMTLLLIYPELSSQRGKTTGRALKIVGVGQEFEKRGDIEQALRKYEEAISVQARFPHGLAVLGRAYHRVGEDDKALEQYEKALAVSPRHYWVHYLIGQVYRDQGRYSDAIHKFEELVVMKDNWVSTNKILGNTEYQIPAYRELGYCYAKIGDRQRAVESYEQYLTLNPSAKDQNAVKEYIEQLQAGDPK